MPIISTYRQEAKAVNQHLKQGSYNNVDQYLEQGS